MADPLLGRDDLLMGDPTLQGVNLQPVLDRLGVKAAVRHAYEPLVLPVVIIDSAGTPFTATVSSQPLDIPTSAGETTAPAANTRLFDTGQLAAGAWDVTIFVTVPETNAIHLRRRNSADNADIWAHRFQIANSQTFILIPNMRIVLRTNERIVVENIGAGGAGVVYQASIWARGPF